MLIIEIALGIVLAWFIINHFEELMEFIASIVSVFFTVVFYPFKLLLKICQFIYRFIRDHSKKIKIIFLISGLLFIFYISVIEYVEKWFQTIEKPISEYLPYAIFFALLSAGLLLFIRDIAMKIYSKFKGNKQI